MNRLTLSIASMIAGLIIGGLIVYALSPGSVPAPPVPHVEHFYYRLTDSSIVRHSISVVDGRLNHTVDTLAVGAR